MRALVALVALAVLLVPSVALAQDKGSEKDTYSTLDLGVHGIFLGGSLDGTDDWNDFWKDGFGLSVGSSRLYRVSEPAEAGFYFRTTFDGFSGETLSFTDATGTIELEPDTLVMNRLVLGGVGRAGDGPLYAEARLGLGIALYYDTDAEVSDATTSVDIEIIESTVAFTFEAALRGGVRVSPKVDLSVGVGYLYNGPPDLGADIEPFADFDYDPQKNVAVDVGVAINF